VGQRTFQRLSLACLVSLCLVIATGEWLRISNSGLGCPSWPACRASGVFPSLTYHALTDFADRCLVVLVGLLIALVIWGAFRLRPRRKELILLSLVLGGGYLAQALLGGGVVLSKLAPLLVNLHLLLGLLLVSDACFLSWLARWPVPIETNALGLPRLQSQASRPVIISARALALIFWLVTTLGVLVAGSSARVGYDGSRTAVSPYASFVVVNANAKTPPASRELFGLPGSISVLLHGASGGILGVLVVVSMVLLYQERAPRTLKRKLWVAMVVLSTQGALGLASWFSHFQPEVSEAHVAGVAVLMIALMNYTLALERPVLARTGSRPVHRLLDKEPAMI
jgi:cytochrome c oxidase assembly protein subunit 15